MTLDKAALNAFRKNSKLVDYQLKKYPFGGERVNPSSINNVYLLDEQKITMIESISKLYKRETEIICKGNTKKTLNFFNSLEARFSNISLGLSSTNVNSNAQKNINNIVRVGDEYFRGLDRGRDIGSHIFNMGSNSLTEDSNRRRNNIADLLLELNPPRGSQRRNQFRPHTRSGERGDHNSQIPNYISMLEQQIMQNIQEARQNYIGVEELQNFVQRNDPSQ